MNILITGGAGFIGSNLAAHFLSKKHKVTVYDNFFRPGVEANLDWLKSQFPSKKLQVITADILDTQTLNSSVTSQDIIFHLAGQTAVTSSVTNPRQDFEFNSQGTFNVLESLRLNNPKATLIYSSTNKVYGTLEGFRVKAGKTRYLPLGPKAIDETWTLDFHSPYGCSKGSADQYVRDYARIYDLNTVVFRQSCIYGTHQLGVEDQGWLAHFAASFIKGTPLNIFGTGKQVRDALFIDDLVKAYELAAENIKTTKGQIYNIGGGPNHTISLIELIDLLTQISGKTIPINQAGQRPGDQKYFVCDISKAKKDFSWQPHISLPQGVEKLYQWLENTLE